MGTLYTIVTFVLAAIFCILLLIAGNHMDGSEDFIKRITRL